MIDIYAYTAGLMDGEGTIALTKNHKKDKFRCPWITLTSTTWNIVEFLKVNFGGTISIKKTYKEHHKKCWVWTLRYDKALALCRNIYPFLLEPSKKNRCEMLITSYKKVTSPNGKYSQDMIDKKIEFEQIFLSV